jgi:plastocyanin
MIPKNAYMPQRSAWFGLLVLLVVALLALAACGGSSDASAGSSPSPTTVANTPTAGMAGATPATTPVTTPATTPTPAPGSTQVVMVITDSSGAYGFSPAMLTIRAGTTVIWKNVSSAPHTITSDDGQAFDSGTVAVGGTYRFTFKTAGAFPYHCNYHPYMRATINVV